MDIIGSMDHHDQYPAALTERKKDVIIMKFKRIFTFLVCVLFTTLLQAQDGKPKVQMADLMRSNGRIYVVVAVMLTILAGLILYLVRLDRKLTKLEKDS